MKMLKLLKHPTLMSNYPNQRLYQLDVPNDNGHILQTEQIAEVVQEHNDKILKGVLGGSEEAIFEVLNLRIEDGWVTGDVRLLPSSLHNMIKFTMEHSDAMFFQLGFSARLVGNYLISPWNLCGIIKEAKNHKQEKPAEAQNTF